MLPSLSGPTPVAALPTLIQGGMGVAVSSWLLASAVARRGHLGVVSGTALDLVLARRLQDGDVDGSARRAIEAFPGRGLAQRVLTRYLRVGGRAGAPYRPVPRPSLLPRRAAQELTVLANFVEVWLAKEGHQGRVGVNYLEKIQLATPAAAYGAMLAGVDAVLMGAGIPRHLPRLLDALARHRAVRLPVDVAGGGEAAVTLDPGDLLGADLADLPDLRRPLFLAIVSSEALAGYLNKDPEIRPDGFVVEAPCAGGHNAPPRGRVVLDERGQPQFGPRDHADVAKIAAVGLPFWLAGGQGTPEALREARAAGAVGVQVGTPFALCAESGLTAALRAEVLTKLHDGTLEVLTDADASPTGFPFKVAQLAGSLSDRAVRAGRPRLCDLGYLRTPYRKADGDVGYRCPAEPVATFVGKGGQEQDAEGSVCLCNALTADVGLGQVDPEGRTELPLVTLGADLAGARRLAALHPEGWTADQAIDWLFSAEPVPA